MEANSQQKFKHLLEQCGLSRFWRKQLRTSSLAIHCWCMLMSNECWLQRKDHQEIRNQGLSYVLGIFFTQDIKIMQRPPGALLLSWVNAFRSSIDHVCWARDKGAALGSSPGLSYVLCIFLTQDIKIMHRPPGALLLSLVDAFRSSIDHVCRARDKGAALAAPRAKLSALHFTHPRHQNHAETPRGTSAQLSGCFQD